MSTATGDSDTDAKEVTCWMDTRNIGIYPEIEKNNPAARTTTAALAVTAGF